MMSLISDNKQLLLIVLLALLLRLPLLNGSFWLDEAAQALESSRPISHQLDIAYDFQPPLLHLITHFALYFGTSEWWLRTVGALIPGVLTIAGLYKLAEIKYGQKTAIIASLLLATNSFHIFYSQELRPYSLPAMFAIWSWVSILKITSHKLQGASFSQQIKQWLAYSNLTILGLYSSYLYPFLIPAQFVYILVTQRKKMKEFLLATSVAGLVFAPWLPFFLEQLSVGQKLRSTLPTWEMVVSIPQLKALPLLFGKFMFGIIELNLDLTTGISACLLVGAVYFSWHKSQLSSTQLKQYILPTLWLLIPVLLAWLVSFFIPVVRPKRFLIALPALYLFLGVVINKAMQTSKKESLNKGVVALAALILLNLHGVYQYYTNPQLQRENWKALISEVLEKFPSSKSIVAFSYPVPFSPWRWYVGDDYPTFATGQLAIHEVKNLTQDLKPITDKNYILVFDYLRDLTDPDDQLLFELKEFGYEEIGALDYPNIGLVRVYVKREEKLSILHRQ